ncbi:hypothetical protein FVEN_g2964 [Fusarium venenatum]|uniref:NAD(P)-binding domain-containing protein n=1 Tax=Fusarium venenatum TaxID=56646 RepID=A0A2L2SW45_9HYPO|nr:uncharacterized protein FVRRES_06350 [Fusarium venenatum]KAG8359221.1 hypothetical protein FVEN_g2964 [Fusarium venenatum]KAH6993351.1 hypothetical protein EDB82DRAFT_524435 [Fusarium venenatum]CEI61914.1 unnamed protein product [Fusarium venenatum]
MAPSITVVPASTRVGTETIRQLLASPEKPSVRGIYRDTAKAPSEYISNPNFEAVKGDVETGIGLDFTGSDGVLYVPPPIYQKKMDLADWAELTATNVKIALHQSNVEKLVVLSGLGARYKHGVGLARLNHETDRILKDAAREVTILHCTHFLEEWRYIFQMPLGDPPSIASWVAPADYKIAMVSIKDIAEVSVKSLLRDSQQPGFHCVKILGPRLYSSNDLKDAFEEVTGHKVKLELAQGDDLKAMLGLLFPEHCIPDIVEVLEASLPGGLVATEYGYDENTFTGKVELVDVIRELHKKYNE